MHPPGDRRDFGARVVDSHAWREARDHLGHPVRAALHHRRAHVVLADGHVHQRVDLLGEERRGLQHADHLGGATADLEKLADDEAVAAKVVEPVVVREHHDRRGAGAVVLGGEAVSDDGGESHHVEVVPGDEAHLHLRRGVVLDEVQRERRVLGDLGQGFG